MDLMKLLKGLIFISAHLRGLWVSILFTIVCLGVYEWGLSRKNTLRSYLENKLDQLTVAKESEIHTHIVLKDQIKAQKDPEWVELVLKKELAVARPHEIKIIFKQHVENSHFNNGLN